MKEYNPTHRALCTRAASWLNMKGFHVTLIERKCSKIKEQPDVIGFKTDGFSHSLEIKVSRADFLADKKKPHRQDGAIAMGEMRSFVCPSGLIKPEEVPDGWGLYYATKSTIRQAHRAGSVKNFDASKAQEMTLLLACYRYIKIGAMITGLGDEN